VTDWDDTDPSRPIAAVEVDCSAGTYVRAIARDLGRTLGTGAYLGALVRTASGAFKLADAHLLEDVRLAAAAGPERLRALLLPPDAGLDRFVRVALTDAEIVAIARGQFVRPQGGPIGPDAERVIATDAAGRPVAVASLRDGRLAPDKVLVDPPAPDPAVGAGMPVGST
jgi:tRNA pseudouridine55 synthase